MTQKKKTTPKNFFLVAGGTGGHVFPALSLYSALAEKKHNVTFITDERGQIYLKNNDVNFKTINNTQIKTTSPVDLLKSFINLFKGLSQSYKILKKEKIDLVVGFGGYSSFTVLLICIFLKIPYCIHEQNSIMGRTNRLVQKKAKKIFFGLPPANKPDNPKHIVIGNPIREKFKKFYHSPYKLPKKDIPFNILIIGGSQGAQLFSSLIPIVLKNLPKDLQKKLNIVQQCRKESLKLSESLYLSSDISVKLCSFFDNIEEEISKAHLVICRSGASTITEVSYVGRPAIFIPLPTAMDNHQYFNALNYSEKEAGWIVEQKKLTVDLLKDKITNLLTEPKTLENAAKQAYQLSQKTVTDDFCNEILNCTTSS